MLLSEIQRIYQKNPDQNVLRIDPQNTLNGRIKTQNSNCKMTKESLSDFMTMRNHCEKEIWFHIKFNISLQTTYPDVRCTKKRVPT